MSTAAEKAAATQTAPTAESIQEALAFLKAFAERKTSANDGKKPEGNEFIDSDIFKTIEIALKSFSEAKAASASAKGRPEDDGNAGRGKMHAYTTKHLVDDEDEADEQDEFDDYDYEEGEEADSDSDDPFAGTYYWNPGPEWKTIGLVAGGAALVGLGALLYKMLDD